MRFLKIPFSFPCKGGGGGGGAATIYVYTLIHSLHVAHNDRSHNDNCTVTRDCPDVPPRLTPLIVTSLPLHVRQHCQRVWRLQIPPLLPWFSQPCSNRSPYSQPGIWSETLKYCTIVWITAEETKSKHCRSHLLMILDWFLILNTQSGRDTNRKITGKRLAYCSSYALFHSRRKLGGKMNLSEPGKWKLERENCRKWAKHVKLSSRRPQVLNRETFIVLASHLRGP